MIFIKQFDEVGRDDIDEAGGKGANLGELTRAGLPVPSASWLSPTPTGPLSPNIGWPNGSSRSRSRPMIRLDTTMPRHRFERCSPVRSPTASGPRSPRPTRALGEASRLPCAPRRRRRTSRRRASPGSRTPTSTSAGRRTRCSRGPRLLGLAVDRAGHGLPRAPGHRPGRRSAWPSSCSRWSTPTRPG